jgi:hypothetical protein
MIAEVLELLKIDWKQEYGWAKKILKQLAVDFIEKKYVISFFSCLN